MSYSPSGQSDRFQRTSLFNATLVYLSASIAAFWRAVTWPAPRTGVMLQPAPIRTPRGKRDSRHDIVTGSARPDR